MATAIMTINATNKLNNQETKAEVHPDPANVRGQIRTPESRRSNAPYRDYLQLGPSDALMMNEDVPCCECGRNNLGTAARGTKKKHHRTDPRVTIRQHYYPEGSWGWVIIACAFTVYMFSGGLQLTYGILLLEVLKHCEHDQLMDAVWLGTLSISSGLFISPIVVVVCRRKSTRLTAILGGLMTALGCLFTSFAVHLHQLFLSYGLLLGIGLGLTRDTTCLMVGQYFKRRREIVEIAVQSGTGAGIALFSYFLRKLMRSLGWRLTLQAAAGVAAFLFVLGLCYRPASLYHPQRRAILHLKNQRKKGKDKSNQLNSSSPLLECSLLTNRALQIIMLCSAFSSIGLYTPLFHLVYLYEQEHLSETSILVLQTLVGMFWSLGCIVFGLLVVGNGPNCFISRQYLCQTALAGVTLSFLSLQAVDGFHGYLFFACMYGAFTGGFHYALKVLTLEMVRTKNFGRAWSYVQCSQFVPVLIGAPVTGYLNTKAEPKVGFYLSAGSTLLAALVLFLLNVYECAGHFCLQSDLGYDQRSADVCTCDHLAVAAFSNEPLVAPAENARDVLGCIEEEKLDEEQRFSGEECVTCDGRDECALMMDDCFEQNSKTQLHPTYSHMRTNLKLQYSDQSDSSHRTTMMTEMTSTL